MQVLSKTKEQLRNLLRYTDELLTFNEKVTFDLAREPYPHFHEFQIASLEGVESVPVTRPGFGYVAFERPDRRISTGCSRDGWISDRIPRPMSPRCLRPNAC
jgi:hypothetical protein